MWAAMFSVTNVLALVSWAILLFAPRRPLPLAVVLYAGVALLCLAYAAGLIWTMARGAGGGVDFTTMAGIRAIFATDAGVAIGWTHYLALDLFTGLWIARDADAKGFSRIVQAPVLLGTFLAGPLGLLIWLFARESRARGPGGWARKSKTPTG
jgi:hypothetical protein